MGLAEVRSGAHPDPTQFDPSSKYYDPQSRPEAPRWDLVDVGFRARFATVITLEELRQVPEFADSPLLRKGNRLSILPITAEQWGSVLGRANIV